MPYKNVEDRKAHYQRNKERILQQRKDSGAYQKWKENANCHCKDCGRLITPKSKSGYCNSCIYKGDRSYMWKEDSIKPASGRARARQLYDAPIGYERHHLDGNTLNNHSDNIKIVTRRQHQSRDGRIEKLRSMAKKAASISILFAKRDTKGRFITR